jgi:NitT/TauT family transport system ATP-binding protein
MTLTPERNASSGGSCYRCEACSVDLNTDRGRTTILSGLNLDIGEGEFVSVMGRSGAGKTTLLRLLGGLLPPSRGSRVTFKGKPVEGPPDGVVIVFQSYGSSLLPWRTVEKNVALGIEGRVPRGERRRRVDEALEMVGLTGRAEDCPWRLSGGMQQRVQIARALAMRPSVLLMDEPFGALDALTKSSLEDELLKVYERTGATVVFVTHDIDEAVYLSDRVLVLQGDPARLGEEVTVDCPRPRDQLRTKESEEFLKARHKVYQSIRTPDG